MHKTKVEEKWYWVPEGVNWNHNRRQFEDEKGRKVQCQEVGFEVVSPTAIVDVVKGQSAPTATAAPVSPVIRTFETGATRDTDEGKLVYEAFISPRVLRRFAEYMHSHRKQPNGEMRAGDNWQKGIPIASYRDSLIRHTLDCWREWRTTNDAAKVEDLLCSILFNVQGYLHELIKQREN